MNITTCKYHDQVHLAVEQDNTVFLPATSNEWLDDINSMLELIVGQNPYRSCEI